MELDTVLMMCPYDGDNDGLPCTCESCQPPTTFRPAYTGLGVSEEQARADIREDQRYKPEDDS